MHRLIVALLAAVDAAIAVAVGIAATLAPLTLLWVFGFGDAADWGALWPASAVDLAVRQPRAARRDDPAADYLAVAGIDPDAASFILSLAPLAFAAFTAIFAARSGARASQADAWITGVVDGLASCSPRSATLVALTSRERRRRRSSCGRRSCSPRSCSPFPRWSRRSSPSGREAGSGAIARLRDRVEAAPHGWGAVPGLIARGAAVVVAGLVGLGALLTAVALVLRGGEIVALYQAGDLDALGAIVRHPRPARLPADARRVGPRLRRGPGFALGEGTVGLARGHAGRRRARHPAPRDRPRLDDAVAAAARAAADRPRRVRGVDRPLAAAAPGAPPSVEVPAAVDLARFGDGSSPPRPVADGGARRAPRHVGGATAAPAGAVRSFDREPAPGGADRRPPRRRARDRRARRRCGRAPRLRRLRLARARPARRRPRARPGRARRRARGAARRRDPAARAPRAPAESARPRTRRRVRCGTGGIASIADGPAAEDAGRMRRSEPRGPVAVRPTSVGPTDGDAGRERRTDADPRVPPRRTRRTEPIDLPGCRRPASGTAPSDAARREATVRR